MDWIDANQLGRRNLTPDQMSYIRGRLYNRTKKAGGGRTGRDLSGGQSDHPKTAETLAAKHGVSEKTIRRDGKREDDNGGLSGGHPMAACTAFVCLLNTVFEKQRSDGKRKNGQHTKKVHSA
jgi:hypothetical protein